MSIQPRKIIFWVHLIAGCAAGAVILLLAGTGLILAFEKQIVAWMERDLRVEAPATNPGVEPEGPLPISRLIVKAATAYPDAPPSNLTWTAGDGQPVAVRYGREHLAFFNPYTGESLGSGAETARAFFHDVLELHRWLLLQDEARDTGKAITGAGCLIFLGLSLTGLVLWWPKKWTRKNLANITVPRWTRNPKARDWNWHNAFGFWMTPLFLIITVTGLIMSYTWANRLLFQLAGSEPPPPRERRGPGGPGGPGGARPGGEVRKTGQAAAEDTTDYEAFFAKVTEAHPDWRTISLKVPAPEAREIEFRVDRSNGGRPDLRTDVKLNRLTGEMAAPSAGDSENNLGRTLRTWVKPVHTGEAAGLPGQVLAALASFAAVLLVWTGLALAWRRFFGRGRKRSAV